MYSYIRDAYKPVKGTAASYGTGQDSEERLHYHHNHFLV